MFLFLKLCFSSLLDHLSFDSNAMMMDRKPEQEAAISNNLCPHLATLCTLKIQKRYQLCDEVPVLPHEKLRSTKKCFN